MTHRIDVTAWPTPQRAAAGQRDWSCSCGKRASSPAPNPAAAEADALRHTPPQNKITRHNG